MNQIDEEFKLERVIKIEEWIFLILLTMLPIVNLIVFIYLSFSKKVNRNKQNFARAVLTYLGILILLVVVTTILI